MRNPKYIVLMLILVGCSNSSEKDQNIVDKTRTEIIKLNQKYNDIFEIVAKEYMAGDQRYEFAVRSIQLLTPELIEVNKALKIDCKRYNDEGKPIMIKGEDGVSHPCYIVPNELKLEE